MKRRSFMKLAAAAATAPFFNVGAEGFGQSRAKRIAAGAKIRLGVVACAGRMGLGPGYGILNNMCADCEVVCLCDPDPTRWEKTLGVVKFRQPETDVSKIRKYYDYHEMLAREGARLDAVAIATPNHHHASAALLAMSMGLHVYVEKPMALTIEEVKLMHAAAKRYGVATQVGNHGHSEEGMRVLVECVQAGMLGQIREVWSFDDRLNAMLTRPPSAPPPKGMDWDSWCGPAPVCDYYAPADGHQGMHPHDWHDWIGYGNGSIGNMGTHIIDPVFWALRLGEVHPESVEARQADWGCAGSWTWRTEVEWKFPARKGMDAVTLHWFDGVNAGVPYDKEHVNAIGCCLKREYQNLPPIILEAEKKYGVDLGALGSLFVGEKGMVKIGPHGNALIFMPKDLKKNFGKVPRTIAREKGLDHQIDWIRAIRNPDRPAGCCFDYSAPLAETVLLGNVAPRAGKKKLLWDGQRITNDEAANAFLKTTYRKGWELKS